MVRPAQIRRGEKLSEDGGRIVPKGPGDHPRGYISPEERQRMRNEQIDDQRRRMRKAQEALALWVN